MSRRNRDDVIGMLTGFLLGIAVIVYILVGRWPA